MTDRLQAARIAPIVGVLLVGTMIMQNDTNTDSLWVETPQPRRCEAVKVADWLADIERAVEAADDDIGRKYRNIGGKNGLELFV